MRAIYTDVDRFILDRWEEVIRLRDAFDDLQERIQEVFDVVGSRLGKWLDPEDYYLENNSKEASFCVWKKSWTRKKIALVYYKIGDLAPRGYRKINSDHPYLWLITRNLDALKMKESERITFARELKQALGESAHHWEADDISDADEPLGRWLTDITDRQRVELVAEPNKLFEFVKTGIEELFTLSDAIDENLAKFRPDSFSKAVSS